MIRIWHDICFSAQLFVHILLLKAYQGLLLASALLISTLFDQGIYLDKYLNGHCQSKLENSLCTQSGQSPCVRLFSFVFRNNTKSSYIILQISMKLLHLTNQQHRKENILMQSILHYLQTSY